MRVMIEDVEFQFDNEDWAVLKDRKMHPIRTKYGYRLKTTWGAKDGCKPAQFMEVTRIIMLADPRFGQKPKLMVDHISRDTTDNRKSNLRVCTKKENTRNKTKRRTWRDQKECKNPYIGVYKNDQGYWRSKIVKDGKTYELGTYNTPDEAAKVRDDFAKVLHRDFASMNEIETKLGEIRKRTYMEVKPKSGGTSKYRGVCWDKRRNCWRMRYKGKTRQFASEKEAARAWNRAASEDGVAFQNEV